MQAIIVAVGDELIRGRTVDTNSAHLAMRLAERGIPTAAHLTVGDDEGAIAAMISQAAETATVVIVTGGLGPTPDDVTRHGVARAMHVELVLNQHCLRQIEAFFARRGRRMVSTNRVQAMIPATAEPLANPEGTAPGIAARLGEAQLFALPGVPHEMRRMFEDGVMPRLPAQRGVILSHMIHTYGAGESDVAAKIRDLMARGANPTVGTTAAAGLISIRIVAAADAPGAARELLAGVTAVVKQRLGRLVVGDSDQTMASVVGELLVRRGETVATAESCTGGLIGEMITHVSGSSAYYRGGVIAYADEVKVNQLGVDPDILARNGAVSEQVAAAMAQGARTRLGATWAVSTTGIAGPTGGTEEKPVGLVWFGRAGPDGVAAVRRVFPGTRTIVQRRAALSALNDVRLALLEQAGG